MPTQAEIDAAYTVIQRKVGWVKHSTVLEALRAAEQVRGAYRILAPGELDPMTLERAAELVEEGREVPDPFDNGQSTIMVDWEDMDALAASIRALKRRNDDADR